MAQILHQMAQIGDRYMLLFVDPVDIVDSVDVFGQIVTNNQPIG